MEADLSRPELYSVCARGFRSRKDSGSRCQRSKSAVQLLSLNAALAMRRHCGSKECSMTQAARAALAAISQRSNRMKAAIFHGPNQPLSIEDVELDKPQDREVLIKTVASGVCHSDLHFVDGLYPYAAPAVLGHEAAGIVEEVGRQGSYVKPGDHVICCLSVFCGTCERCMSGHPNLCSNKVATQRKPGDKPRISQKGQPVNQFLDISSYCEKMLLHENAVVKIREDLPLDRAALIGCGVTTGVGAVLNTAKIEPGSTVAVFGAGGVGLAAIQGARIAGARKIIAVDMFEGKLAMAKRLGATDTVDASSSDPVDEIRKLTGGGVDYSFEAIGLKKVAEQAFNALKPGGTAT